MFGIFSFRTDELTGG